MGKIINFIQNLLFETELTPKGECFFNYIRQLNNGSDDHIEAYDDDIEEIRQTLNEVNDYDFTTEEAITILDVYFTEKYE